MTDTAPVYFIRKTNPFANMKIADNSFLAEVSDRQPCSKCYKSRKFFCYTCYVPLPNMKPYPQVKVRKNLFHQFHLEKNKEKY